MASLNSFAVLEWIRKIQGEEQIDFLRELVQMFAQSLIDAEATQKVGANPYERTEERKTQRNGYRKREWNTRLGTLDLKIPKLRQGSFFPSILEPRRRAEQTLAAVVQEAYVNGVSTRKVDDVVRALGLDGPLFRWQQSAFSSSPDVLHLVPYQTGRCKRRLRSPRARTLKWPLESS